jgi:hypothetical protein
LGDKPLFFEVVLSQQQAAVPYKRAIFARALQAVGRFEARHCVTFINHFLIDLIFRKIVDSKICKNL